MRETYLKCFMVAIHDEYSYKNLFEGIVDSDTFTLIYNKDNTEEISEEIKNNWVKILTSN